MIAINVAGVALWRNSSRRSVTACAASASVMPAGCESHIAHREAKSSSEFVLVIIEINYFLRYRLIDWRGGFIFFARLRGLVGMYERHGLRFRLPPRKKCGERPWKLVNAVIGFAGPIRDRFLHAGPCSSIWKCWWAARFCCSTRLGPWRRNRSDLATLKFPRQGLRRSARCPPSERT